MNPTYDVFEFNDETDLMPLIQFVSEFGFNVGYYAGEGILTFIEDPAYEKHFKDKQMLFINRDYPKDFMFFDLVTA